MPPHKIIQRLEIEKRSAPKDTLYDRPRPFFLKLRSGNGGLNTCSTPAQLTFDVLIDLVEIIKDTMPEQRNKSPNPTRYVFTDSDSDQEPTLSQQVTPKKPTKKSVTTAATRSSANKNRKRRQMTLLHQSRPTLLVNKYEIPGGKSLDTEILLCVIVDIPKC